MHKRQIRNITEARLRDWTERLVANHATPLLLVGVGHDEESGQLHIMVPQQLNHAGVKRTLRRALELLDTPGPDQPLSEVDPEPEPD